MDVEHQRFQAFNDDMMDAEHYDGISSDVTYQGQAADDLACEEHADTAQYSGQVEGLDTAVVAVHVVQFRAAA